MAEPIQNQQQTPTSAEPTEATPLLAAPARAPLNRRTWATRALRANNILGIIIPALIVLLAIKGYELVVFQTSAYIAHVLHRPLLARLYAIQFNIFLWPLVFCWVAVWIISARSVPPSELSAGVVDRSAVFECDAEGKAVVCWQDNCAGRWKPMRARHCKDCGTCRTGFDHHCAFMSACVTSANLPFFLAFLVLTLPLIGIAIVPLVPLQIAAMKEVVRATWETEWMRDAWWSRWFSWAGGPIWRWAFGLGLAYTHYTKLNPPRTPLFEAPPSCEALAVPRLGVLLTCVAGFFVFWVAVAMIVTIVRNAAAGLTSVQVSRHRAWLAYNLTQHTPDSTKWDPRLRLWVPPPAPEEGEEAEEGAILVVDPGVRLHDFGSAWENLRRALILVPGAHDELPKAVVKKLQKMAIAAKTPGSMVESPPPVLN